MNRIIFFLFAISIASVSLAQKPQQWRAGEILHEIQKAQVLGSVLYVAAHPDDENTRLISYLANERKYKTTYLSLTRGDGGQNLIGTEIRDELGLLRTQELLAARRTDGGHQAFSRANDFGYSKNPEETMEIWNKKEVLSDVVWAIRKHQPDVIITRFNPVKGRRTHGHHTASAMLAKEAFSLSGNLAVNREHLAYHSPWQAKRLMFNTSWWFFGSREKFKAADKSDMVSVDAGVYYPLLGKSNNEIAAESRSQHRCQGMGSMPSRGGMMEYLKFIEGDQQQDDMMDGVNTTWTRLEGGEVIGKLLAAVEAEFDLRAPHKSVDKLTKALGLIRRLPKGHYQQEKEAELTNIITACLGLYAEATSPDYYLTKVNFPFNLEIVNRSPVAVKLNEVQVKYLDGKSYKRVAGIKYDEGLDLNGKDLKNNEVLKASATASVMSGIPYSSPYWLKEDATLGMYGVKEQALRGLPENPRPVIFEFDLSVNGEKIKLEKALVQKEVDPAFGVRYRPVESMPAVFVKINQDVLTFADTKSKKVDVEVQSNEGDLKASLSLDLPKGWSSKPKIAAFEIKNKAGKQIISFELTPPNYQSVAEVKAVVKTARKNYRMGAVELNYEHVPRQTILKPATAKIVRIDLKKAGDKVGYIMGAGDKVPESLEQIGYQVDLLGEDDIIANKIKQYDAIVLGIRALNTKKWMAFKQVVLLEYVKQGGTLMIQYNTAHRLVTKDIAPFQMKLSRDRVTVEEAEIRILKPNHPALNFPNKITKKDFDNWVQERGLYFPNEWDTEKFDALLSSNDPNEPARDGGLLVAKHGEGYFVYSGYSWFRQLPAGVPGAYRIFANLISLGQE